MCTTPRCTLPKHHLGLHSYETFKDAYTCPAVHVAEHLPYDEYGRTPPKRGHRDLFIQYAKECQGKLLYLDCEGGYATLALKAGGVAEKRLVPCNSNKFHCQAIERASSVPVVHADIMQVARDAARDEYGAIWYDLESNTIDFPSVAHASEIAMITLSSRKLFVDDQVQYLQCLMHTNGFRLDEISKYRGKGGSMTMVFGAARRVRSSPTTHVYDPGLVGTILSVPVQLFGGHEHWQDAYMVRDGKLMCAITGYYASGRCRVKFASRDGKSVDDPWSPTPAEAFRYILTSVVPPREVATAANKTATGNKPPRDEATEAADDRADNKFTARDVIDAYLKTVALRGIWRGAAPRPVTLGAWGARVTYAAAHMHILGGTSMWQAADALDARRQSRDWEAFAKTLPRMSPAMVKVVGARLSEELFAREVLAARACTGPSTGRCAADESGRKRKR